MNTIKDNWDKILERTRLESGIEDLSFKTWLKPLTPLYIEDNILIIATDQDNQLATNYITRNYLVFIKEAIGFFTGEDLDLKVIPKNQINTKKVMESEGVKQEISKKSAQLANLNAKYTFERFVVGNNNRFAHSACLAVAESPGESYNPLYIYGGPGLGKTHLMQSIGHFILEHNPDMKVIYVNSEAFTNEVIESIRSGSTSSMSKLREKYRTVDVLMIDDIQFIAGKNK